MTTKRRTIFDEPDEVYAVGWKWKRRNSSGGSREVFLSHRVAEKRVQMLYDDAETEVEDITVWRLTGGSWALVEVHAPTSAALQSGSTEADR